jgi:hypothetical protein
MVDASPREVALRGSRCRVLLIGDSFTEGYGVGWQVSFAGLLAERWKRRDVELLNAGVSGYAPSIYYRRVRHLIEDVGLKFDAVLVAIDITDIRDEWMNYDMDEKERVVRISRDFPPKFMRPATALDRIVFIAVDNSLAARLTFAIAARWVFRSIYYVDSSPDAPPVDPRPHLPPLRLPLGDLSAGLVVSGTSPDRASQTFIGKYGYWTLDRDDWVAYGRDGLQVAAERMDRLVALLRRNNIPLRISVHPWPTNLRAGDVDSVQVQFWREWARQRNVGFIDLFPAFFEVGPEVSRSHFLADEFHWNARGHALVADEIFRRYDPRSDCRG